MPRKPEVIVIHNAQLLLLTENPLYSRQAFSYADPADRNPPPDAEYIIITIFEGKTETSSDNNV